MRKEDIEALARGTPRRSRRSEIAFTPARVLLQDFTGVPCVVDLAAMRDAMADARRRPGARSTRCVPVELVIDHSVQVDEFGTPRRVPDQRRARVRAQPRALRVPALGPGRVRRLQGRAAGHRHRAPGQPRVPRARRRHPTRQRRRSVGLSRHARRHRLAHDDDQRPRRARLGRRRHRGRGGDARPADLDADPAGRRLQARTASCREGATATDLVLTVTQMLREHGVVGKFVEFYGPGLAEPAAGRPRDDRQHGPGVRRRPARSSRSTTRRCATCEFTGPPEGARRARRGLRARSRACWHDETLRGADVLRHARARPRRRRADARRAEAPAGPRRADRVQGLVPDGARRLPAARQDDDDEAVEESFPASDPPAVDEHPHERRAAGAGTGGAQVADRVTAESQVTLADGTEHRRSTTATS